MTSNKSGNGKKYGPKFYETEATLPDDLKPVFRQLVDEYTFIGASLAKWKWAAYGILAELVLGGWRPSADPQSGYLLEKESG